MPRVTGRNRLITKQHVRYDPSSSVAEIYALTLSLLTFPLSSPARPGTTGSCPHLFPAQNPPSGHSGKERSCPFPPETFPLCWGRVLSLRSRPFPWSAPWPRRLCCLFSGFPTPAPPCLGDALSSLEACLSVMDSEKPFLIPGLNWNPLFLFFHYSGSSLRGFYQNLSLCV